MSSKLSAKLNEENYQKLISWLLHGNDVSNLKEEWFLHLFYKGIYQALCIMQELNMPFVFDEVFSTSKECLHKLNYKGSIQYSDIETIYNNFDDFTNIKQVIKKVKDDYIKSVESAHILEDLLSIHGSLDNIPLDKLKGVKERIEKALQEIEAEECNAIMPVVIQRYENDTIEREVEGIKRTLGFKNLDKFTKKAAYPKQMMTIFGESGSGKSLFTQAIINQIINNPRKVPVAYFTLEMSLEDVMDRFLSMREGISSDDLMKPDKSERLQSMINRGKERMKAMDHFHIYDPSALSINDLDRYITQSKEIWREKGVLGNDEYNVVAVDLLTMLTDFGDMSPQRMEQTINKLHNVYRKHNTFLIAVVQANENQLRQEKRFKKPEQVKHYQLLKSDIKGSAVIFERSRVVASLIRRRELMKTYFPLDKELWESMRDLIDYNCIKNNNGPPFYTQFSFEVEPSYKIFPFEE